ncbi:MAG: MFS transporter [Oscillospiraceae bacterium]|nr:MFS transporter [Oscillospiraceae bacterium]
MFNLRSVQKNTYIAPEPGSALWNRNFCIIAAMACCTNFANYFVGSSLSLWLIDMGRSHAAYGTLHSLFSLVAMLARPVTGWMIDHGDRKKAFILSSIVYALSLVLMLYSPIFGLFVAMRLIQGAGNGCSYTVCNTSAYDYMPRDKMEKGVGYMTLFSSLISALTATLSVGTYTNRGPAVIVLFSVIAVAVGVLLSFTVVFRSPADRRPFRFRDVFNLRQLFEKSALSPSLLAAFSVNFAFGVRSYIILFGRSIGISNPGWFTSVSAIGLLIVRFLLDRTHMRAGTRRGIIYLAYGVLVVYFLMLSFCSNIFMYLGAALLWSVIYGILVPQLQSMAVGTAPVERRGAAGSTFLCATDIGIICGSLTGGILTDSFGYRRMFLLGLIPVALCILYYAFFLSKKIK